MEISKLEDEERYLYIFCPKGKNTLTSLLSQLLHDLSTRQHKNKLGVVVSKEGCYLSSRDGSEQEFHARNMH